MSPSNERGRELRLTAEEQGAMEETIAATVAVQVYRQLQGVASDEDLARGANIAGNSCSCSSSKAQAVMEAR